MKKTGKFLSRGTIFNIVAVGIFALGISICYGLYRQANNIYPTNNRIAETLYTICHPLKEQYDTQDYRVTPLGDGSMGVEYIINNPEQAFDIVREIDTLRKDSIYLSKALIHIHIRSAQPDGVDFRVDPDGGIFVLELNTSPGFTSHSLVPKAGMRTGLTFAEVCDKILSSAATDARG